MDLYRDNVNNTYTYQNNLYDVAGFLVKAYPLTSLITDAVRVSEQLGENLFYVAPSSHHVPGAL